MASTGGDSSRARMLLLDGVVLLHPEDAVFEAMVEGWARRQRGGRRLATETILGRQRIVRRFMEGINEYPWTWTSGHVDEWMMYLVAEKKRARSTIRSYQDALKLFCDYITSPYYQGPEVCEARFGTHPVQVRHEWNTIAHLTDYEGRPGRRPSLMPRSGNGHGDSDQGGRPGILRPVGVGPQSPCELPDQHLLPAQLLLEVPGAQ